MLLVHRLWQCEYGNSFPSPAEDENMSYVVSLLIFDFMAWRLLFYPKTNRETTILLFTTTTTTIKARSCLSIHNNPKVCVISGFRREVGESCTLVGYYVASSVQELSRYAAPYQGRQPEVIFSGVSCSPFLPVVIS